MIVRAHAVIAQLRAEAELQAVARRHRYLLLEERKVDRGPRRPVRERVQRRLIRRAPQPHPGQDAVERTFAPDLQYHVMLSPGAQVPVEIEYLDLGTAGDQRVPRQSDR